MGIRRPDRNPDERGASLVEFAILAPLLVILVFGVIEFGYMFAQLNDLRHAVREGARYAAVNGGSNADISNLVCSTVENLSGGMSNLVVTLTDGSNGLRGDTDAAIDVSVDVSSLSGVPLITDFLPSTLNSSVDFRLEQDSGSWGTGTTVFPDVSC